MAGGIAGVTVTIDDEAVVLVAADPLSAMSSAVLGGGATRARAIVNVHVPKGFQCRETPDTLARFIARRGLPAPVVGLLTAAATDRAETAVERDGALTALAVVTVGLSNRSAAGRERAAAWRPSTINTVLVVDADPEAAAMVNLVITATEVKALVLATAGVRAGDGGLASGTSTDAVVVAATGRGPVCRYGGPLSELGAVAARAVRAAMEAGVRRWLAEHPE